MYRWVQPVAASRTTKSVEMIGPVRIVVFLVSTSADPGRGSHGSGRTTVGRLSIPAESPTAWASLNTGRNPAETGVPGFVRNTRKGDLPSVGFGHLDTEVTPLEELAHAPVISTGSPLKWQLIIGISAFVAFMVLAIGQEWSFFSTAWFGRAPENVELSSEDRDGAVAAVRMTLELTRHLYSSGGDPRFSERMPASEQVVEAAERYEQLLEVLGNEQLQKIAVWKMKGYTNEEIAGMLSCSRATVVRKLDVIRQIWNAERDDEPST